MEERDEWIIYVAGLLSMSVHPGAGTRDHKPLTLEDCARMADEMVQRRKLRYSKEN